MTDRPVIFIGVAGRATPTGLEGIPLTRTLLYLCCVSLACCAGLCLTGCQPGRQAPPSPPPPTVTVAQPVTYPVQAYYEYNGHLDSVEMVQVRARVKGFLNEIAFTEGDEVKQGDLLFKIDPREYAAAVKSADADRRRAAADLERARSEAGRASRLRSTRAVGAEEYEQRVAARDTAEAALMQAQAALEASQIQLGYTEIRSPIAGQISRALVTRGNLVGQNENTLLTTIVSMDPLFVFFDAPERDLVEYQRSLRPGQEDDLLERVLPVEIGVATEDGYPHAGKIDFRENRVDVGTGTVRVRGRIPNPRVPPGNARLLYPGLYARVRVPAGDPRPMPAIPEDALMTGQEGRYVYVLGEGDVVQKRTVKVGPHVWKAPPAGEKPTAGWTLVPPAAAQPAPVAPVPSVVAIEGGLTPGDRVVVNGLTKARPGAPVAPESWALKPPANPVTK
jgi:membrane fusion protein, multidrug efflux system